VQSRKDAPNEMSSSGKARSPIVDNRVWRTISDGEEAETYTTSSLKVYWLAKFQVYAIYLLSYGGVEFIAAFSRKSICLSACLSVTFVRPTEPVDQSINQSLFAAIGKYSATVVNRQLWTGQ